MSPRRTATSGEDNILALLEREPARKRGGATTGGRLAWCGAGAAVALVLTGSLVWLAANNGGTGQDLPDTVLANAGKAPPNAAPAVAAGSSARPANLDAPAGLPADNASLRQVAMVTTLPDQGEPSRALIVDQSPPNHAEPPLRLLKPTPAKAASMPVRTPVPPTKAPARAAVTAASPPYPLPSASSEAKAPARAAATPAKPRQVLVTKNVARPAPPKAQRSAMPARTAENGVDADVALISAVIMHANGHAPEGSQMTELLCPNDSCQARPSRQ